MTKMGMDDERYDSRRRHDKHHGFREMEMSTNSGLKCGDEEYAEYYVMDRTMYSSSQMPIYTQEQSEWVFPTPTA